MPAHLDDLQVRMLERLVVLVLEVPEESSLDTPWPAKFEPDELLDGDLALGGRSIGRKEASGVRGRGALDGGRASGAGPSVHRERLDVGRIAEADDDVLLGGDPGKASGSEELLGHQLEVDGPVRHANLLSAKEPHELLQLALIEFMGRPGDASGHVTASAAASTSATSTRRAARVAVYHRVDDAKKVTSSEVRRVGGVEVDDEA